MGRTSRKPSKGTRAVAIAMSSSRLSVSVSGALSSVVIDGRYVAGRNANVRVASHANAPSSRDSNGPSSTGSSGLPGKAYRIFSAGRGGGSAGSSSPSAGGGGGAGNSGDVDCGGRGGTRTRGRGRGGVRWDDADARVQKRG